MNQHSHILPNGTLLNKKELEIVEFLDQGGFGITYKVHNPRLGTFQAVKELFIEGHCVRPNGKKVVVQGMDLEKFEKFKDRFVAEGGSLAKCNHPNIVRIIDIFIENNTAYLLMNYIEGSTLENKVKTQGALSEQMAKLYLRQMAEALRVVHGKKLLHRDVKPSNIMVNKLNQVVLIDFGNAKQYASDQNLTSDNSRILSPGYAPMEQYGTRSPIRAYSDIYSIGATLYFMLTKKKPMVAIDRSSSDDLPSVKSLNTSVSQGFNDLIMKAMAMKPADRHQSIDELLDALKNLNASKPQPKIDLIKKDTTQPKPNENTAILGRTGKKQEQRPVDNKTVIHGKEDLNTEILPKPTPPKTDNKPPRTPVTTGNSTDLPKGYQPVGGAVEREEKDDNKLWKTIAGILATALLVIIGFYIYDNFFGGTVEDLDSWRDNRLTVIDCLQDKINTIDNTDIKKVYLGRIKNLERNMDGLVIYRSSNMNSVDDNIYQLEQDLTNDEGLDVKNCQSMKD